MSNDKTEYERKGLQSDQVSIEPSTIETIDLAIYDWLDKTVNIHTNTNRGWKKTPVIWVAAERAHQIKFDRTLRDVNGNFILPAITIQRENITKTNITISGSNFNQNNNYHFYYYQKYLSLPFPHWSQNRYLNSNIYYFDDRDLYFRNSFIP